MVMTQRSSFDSDGCSHLTRIDAGAETTTGATPRSWGIPGMADGNVEKSSARKPV